MLRFAVMMVWLTFATCSARFKTICPTVVSTITCHNDTKIFIESVMYGRTDNFTCPPTSLCDPSIDLSGKVTPICQGKSSCDINGSYDGLEKPCNTSYFNISYTCKKINVTEIKEHHIGNFVCPKGKVFVAHRLEWLGIEYILKSRNISAPNSTIPLVATSTNNLSMIWSTSKSNRKVLQTQVVASTSLLASGFHISSTALVTQKKTATTPSLFTMMINSSSTSGSESLAASSRPSSPLFNSVMKSPGVSATLSETLISEGSFSSSPLPTTAAPVTTPSLLSSTLLNPGMLPSMTSSPTIATFFPRQSTEVRLTKPSLSLKNSPDKTNLSLGSSSPTTTTYITQPSITSFLSTQNKTLLSTLSATTVPNVSVPALNSSRSIMPEQKKYEYYNITQKIKPKKVHTIKLFNCRGKMKCYFNVTRKKFTNPYPEKITELRLSVKHSCQTAENGYLQWESWSACPDVCGITYHQVRRRICQNPTTTTGGGDCSGHRSETLESGCYKECLDRNSTTCHFLTANLSCPNGTFINIISMFYGREQENVSFCDSSGLPDGACVPLNDIAGHNRAQVYERCQMKSNCTIAVSNDTFRDPCPGFSKHLKINYTCSPIFTRTFCDADKALLSCPAGMRVVFHNTLFYGQMNTSESCPVTASGSCRSGLNYGVMDEYCWGVNKCDIPKISATEFKLRQCKDTSNYLTIHHSCQRVEAIYTPWGPWRPCEACGLTTRRIRERKCVSPGIEYFAPPRGCNYWSNLVEQDHCYHGCGDKTVSLDHGENTTIVCPKDDIYHTVIEIRSVFYGNESCPSNNGSKIAVMKRCQGRNQCYLEASTAIFNDSCPGIKKFLNVTYRCQSIYRMKQSERYTMVPTNLSCYDNMVIVTHAVSWDDGFGNCNYGQRAMTIIQNLCDGRNSCVVLNKKSLLGGSCGSYLKFVMYYSCQTAYGGLDTEWSAWSNCTECGHTPVKRRIKPCLSPINKNSGAHCPLIEQIAPCNFPCPVDGLSFIGDDFSVVLGQNFSIQWKLRLGTNSTGVISWGDNSVNETVGRYIMANASTPFSLVNWHNYTFEGEFWVKVYAFNYFSNQTIYRMVYVQVKLCGLNFTAPTTVATNTSSHFNVSLEVVSLKKPLVLFSFGNGVDLSSTCFETNYTYPKAGVFMAYANAKNKVSSLTSTRKVIVQDPVRGFKADREIYFVTVGHYARFLFSIEQGTNVSVNASLYDCELPFLATWLNGPSHLNSLLTCVFDKVGTCNGFFYASNKVSQANASALIISEVAIHGFNVTVECQSRYPSCFQHDRIVFHINVTNGTRPKFVFHMGDGNVVISSEKTLDYFFRVSGSFNVNITAHNNVSSISILRKIDVSELVPMSGAYVNCNKTVGLSDLTMCSFGVQQGTAFECWLDLGDNNQPILFFTYFNLTSFISYNLTSYGEYTVQFLCNNAINSSSAKVVTKVVPRSLKLGISQNGPVMVNRTLTLTLSASETGYPSCFTLDLGNSQRIVFGSLNCTTGEYEKSFPYPSLQYNYTYTKAATYNVTWSGQNNFTSESVHSLVIITELPCLKPQVILQNVASNRLSPAVITRSKEFIVSSRNRIDCERATGAILQWKILKNTTDKGFVLQSTRVTERSDLILLSNELEYGLYCIKLTLTLQNAFDIAGTAEGYFKVTTSKLIADLQDGSANRRSYLQPVFINATGSLDPDSPDSSKLEFKWYCYNITDRLKTFNYSKMPLSTLADALSESPLPNGCFGNNGSMVANSSEIILPQQKVIENGLYLVKLVLSSGNREASKATVIQVVNDEIPQFYIRCVVNCKRLVITTDILSVSSHCFSGTCEKGKSGVYSWELFHRSVNETDGKKWNRVADLEGIASSNTSSKNLVLKAYVLHPEMSYVVRMWYKWLDHESLAEYSFTTSRPPYGGNCSVSPSAGEAYQTMFTFECAGWQTKNMPLLYVVSYYDPYTQLKPVLYRAEEDRFLVKLALGDSNDNFRLKIFFSVIDSFGARMDTQRLIQVLPRKVVPLKLDELILKDNSKLNFYLNIGDIDSVSELVSGVMSSLNHEAIHRGNGTSSAEIQSEVRYTIMQKISRIPISTMTDINQVSTMIAAASEIKEHVNSTAQEIATNKISSMINLLLNKSRQDIGVSVVTDGAENLVTAVFNVLMSASYSADLRRMSVTDELDQNKSKTIAYENIEAFEKVAEAVSNKLLPGQEDIEIQTKSAILTCRRAKVAALTDHPINAGNASVNFPDLQGLIGNKTVDVQLLYLPKNPYTWDKSSQLVTTAILDVKIKEITRKRQVIDILDLAGEIDLQIPFEPTVPEANPDIFYKQTDNESIQYHSFEIKKTNEAIEFYIIPLENQEQLTILIKFKEKPTILEHDLQMKLPNFSSCSIKDTFRVENNNCTDNPYSLFLPSTYLTKVGKYFIGVKYGETTENKPSSYYRQKRDCGAGRRSKRGVSDCIQYKDPPTTRPFNGKFVSGQQSYDNSKHSNYSMEQFGLGCNFWNPAGNQFSGGGCRTGRRRTLSRTMTCRCKHLTSFGGGFLVKPNPIDFDKVWYAFADIHNNVAVLVSIVSVFLLYLLVIIWARRADRKDHSSQGGTLVIGKSSNAYVYEVTISTNKGRNSGTTANITFLVVGENGSSGTLPLSKLTKVKFKRGTVVTVVLSLPSSLGQLLYLHIWHDNSGDNPSWYLDHVAIRDVLTDEKWNFMCRDWLAVESGDGRTEKVLYVANINEMANYRYLFLSHSADGLYDEHLWISVAAKPPQSSFSRVQRASCCLSILFCTMITNAMFYDSGKADTSSVFYLGPIKITMRQLMIGIQSSLIIFPINLAITQLFRKSSNASMSLGEAERAKSVIFKRKPKLLFDCFDRRVKPLSKKYLPMTYEANSTTSISTLKSASADRFTDDESMFNLNNAYTKISQEKKRKSLYMCLYYFAWVLCFVSVLTSAFFTLSYSLQWGSERSQQWLLSFFVSFIQDAAISQPVKVALFSAVIAFVIKFTLEQKEKRQQFKRKKVTLNDKGEKTCLIETQSEDSIPWDDSQPLRKNILEKAKMKRMKEIKSSEVMTDVFFYSLFLLLLLIVAYGHRDPIAYEYTKHLENYFSIETQQYPEVLHWVRYIFIPQIFVGSWYNGMAPTDSEDGYLPDRTSSLVGMARLRQLRILNDTCGNYIQLNEKLGLNCYGQYSMDDEDTSIYQEEWVPVSPDIPIENITYHMCPRPWRYQTAMQLKGVPIWGKIALYSGGGYVAELGYYPDKAIEVVSELFEHNWVDRRSRAVFVELTVYNAQVNLFCVISLLMEVMPTGGVAIFRRINTIRVYRYIGELANLSIAAELIIVLVILYLLYKVIKRIYHKRIAFFKKFWNLVDLLQVLFALVSIGLYFVKMVNINMIMKDLSENPFVFVSFSLLLTWNEIDTFMISFVVFLTTLKLLYLLRYNNYIKLLNQTFSNMRTDILSFMVQFLLWFMPFVILAHITFGAHLQDFISLPSAFQAMLNALLGASYYHDLEQVDRVIGPALFFCFSILMELILLNMFVSIINSAFGSRVENLDHSQPEPELVEFIMARLRGILGVNLLSTRVTPDEKWYVDDSSDEDNDLRLLSTKNTLSVLNRKLTHLQTKFTNVTTMEEEEEDDVWLEMVLLREHESLASSRSEGSATTQTSF